MAIGGLLCAINPKNLILKVLGYVFAFAGAIYGLKCSGEACCYPSRHS